MTYTRYNAVMKVFGRAKGREKMCASWMANGTQYATDSIVAYMLKDEAIINGLPKLKDEMPKLNLDNCAPKIECKDKLEMSVKAFKEQVLKYPYIVEKSRRAYIVYKDDSAEHGIQRIGLDASLLQEVVNVMTESDRDIITIQFFKPKCLVVITSSRFPTSKALLAPISAEDTSKCAYVFTQRAFNAIDPELLRGAHFNHMQAVKMGYLDRIENEITKALKSQPYNVKRPIDQIVKLVENCEFKYTSDELSDLEPRAYDTNKLLKEAGYEEIDYKSLFKKLEGKNEWDDFSTLEQAKEDDEFEEEEEVKEVEEEKEEPKPQAERKAIVIANNDHQDIITPKVEDTDTWKIDEYKPEVKQTFSAYLINDERNILATFDTFLEARDFLKAIKDKLFEIKDLNGEEMKFEIVNDLKGNIAYQESVRFEYVDFDDLFNTDEMSEML